MKNPNANLNTNKNTDPTSPNYQKNIRNKANENSPSGEDEPSINTTYK